MNFSQYRTQALLSIAAIAAIIIMLQLPKVSVRNADKQLSVNNNQSNPNSNENSAEGQKGHTHQHSKAEWQRLSNFQKQLQQATNATQKQQWTDSLTQFYKAHQQLDSVAYYKAQLIEAFPNNNRIVLEAADAYLEAFKYAIDPKKATAMGEKARLYYEKLSTKDANNADLKVKIGVTYLATQNPMQGISLIKEVLDKDPKNRLALYYLGTYSIQTGQYDKAIQRLEKLTEIEPNNEEVQLYLAEAYLQVGKRQEAKQLLETLIKTSKDSTYQIAAKDYLKQIEK
ncbi:MAG: tetratricopeptide repeat protein [Cytophagales bacterium]|nr:MAG: tetratricopeptide repeat protein [Cytophagales bacterium]